MIALRKRLRAFFPYMSLPIILAACLLLWGVTGAPSAIEVESADGVWDLRDFDFARESAVLVGQVEYIPDALLTPEEFEARAGEARVGKPELAARYATSRITILLPDGVTFALARQSIDYAYRLYVNGKPMAQVGVPGDSAQATTPNTADVTVMDEAQAGRIVVIQQSANFVHREGGWHDGIQIGYPQNIQRIFANSFAIILMGCFLALFLVHLTLFCILPSYRANLYFSLFCIVWCVRTGVTGHKLFSTLLPQLSWYAKFRMEYIALPVTGILLILMLHTLFPGVLPRWFRRAAYAVSGLFAGLFLVGDTVWMSYAIYGCYGYQVASIATVAICFMARLRRPNMAQWISIAGVGLFLYAGLRDMFYYSNIILPPATDADISRVAMLFFILCQMTAMFIGTVRAAEDAKAVEQRLAAENAALDRMNLMKNDLIATISHETRTPLAVLSGYAELIAMEMRHEGVESQTANDLAKVADEAQRIASIMDAMQDLSRQREAGTGRAPTQLCDILRQAARLYAPILARRGTMLSVDCPDALPLVYANASELTQVMFNLLANARSHTEGGSVTIGASAGEGKVTVVVADTGEGIRPEFLPHAFVRGRHDNPDGSGLGLTICREIITGHGGDISLESRLGEGATVRFALPTMEEA